MNAEHLLQHFERLSETPDAIPLLRRFILNLAVHGKLVEQDPNDEPAVELLQRIQAEKARLVKERKIKKLDLQPKVNKGETPFDLPRSWGWSRLGNVLTKLTDGTHHSPPNDQKGEFKYVTAKNIKSEGISLANITHVSMKIHNEIYARCNPAKGDILYVKDGATTGVVTINGLDEPFSMLSSVALLKLPSCLFNRLIVEFLRSPFFYNQMRGFMKGAAITRVTLKRMAPALIPIPPLAEQHRIVAKVDELMALCDQLEKAKTEREQSRDRLVAASLQRLIQPADDKIFRADARFTFDHLQFITTRPAHIKQLRQTILNLAVRGRLVPQDVNDEPAAELLKQVSELTGQPFHLEWQLGDQLLFELPQGWEWSHIGVVTTKTGSGSTPRGGQSVYQASGVPFLRSQNVYDDGLRLNDVAYIDESTHAKMRGTALESGDLLLNITGGSIGRCCRLPDTPIQANISQHVAIIRLAVAGMRDFVHKVVLSPYFQSLVMGEQTGAGRGGLPKNRMDRIPIPVPPQQEQHRIVAKIDELMEVCDQLEARLTTSLTESHRLLEAVLHKACLK